MDWVDVSGCPASGKSAICYEWWSDRSVIGDGKPPHSYWKPFLDEIMAMMPLVADHVDPMGRPTIQAVQRMCDRSIRKMSAVERMDRNICAAGSTPEIVNGKLKTSGIFIQTGLVQRILGFGWRLHDMKRDINLIRPALWRMPVSIGVVILTADVETLLARNRQREEDFRQGKVPRNENRSHQVPHMLACMPLVKEVLLERGVPVVAIDVERQSIDEARAQLLAFADRPACDAAKMGLGR